MRYATVCIESIGYELPKHVVTSAEIEARLSPLYDRLQLPYGRLEMMSGIRERRFWDDGVNPSDAAALAERKVARPARGLPPRDGRNPHLPPAPALLEPRAAPRLHSGMQISRPAAPLA